MRFIKKNGKYIGIVMVCVFCSYLTTIATNYIFESSDVRFDNTGTSLESVNVQDAIDETFHHVTDYNEIKTTIGNSTLTTTNQTLIGGINELNSNLGLPSSASGVTGADAFSKINTLNSKIESYEKINMTSDFGAVAGTITLIRWGKLRVLNFDGAKAPSQGFFPFSYFPTSDCPAYYAQGYLRRSDNNTTWGIWVRNNGSIGQSNYAANVEASGSLIWVVP